MAILQYSNGIIEDLKAKDLVFTDQEILNLLEGFTTIRTHRLIEVSNTWCIWGQNTKFDPIEFNPLGSSVVNEPMHSPLIIIHDTELDPAWALNDPIILKSYLGFKKELLIFFDSIATEIINEKGKSVANPDDQLMFLETLGPTKDKKILFKFNHKKQSKEFFEEPQFSNFINKVKNYWKEFFYKNLEKEKNTCIIYADQKIILIVDDNKLDSLIELMINKLEKEEKYETCSILKSYKKIWKSYIKNEKKSIIKKKSDEKEK